MEGMGFRRGKSASWGLDSGIRVKLLKIDRCCACHVMRCLIRFGLCDVRNVDMDGVNGWGRKRGFYEKGEEKCYGRGDCMRVEDGDCALFYGGCKRLNEYRSL